ncbi:holin [Nocardia sp. CDC159]|uniref:Holin n=1 Tax=Nocardia pulmonis TaxID=2951408 RepID=A0A9X2E673_9NOCA|nr:MULTISPECIES: holin [Nocardia]MCM6774989.1 holin [Nocardia pulmonis]MCM6789920.1 holin [Nocardia sp. CDC159]
MTTLAFWQAAAERALKTFAQALLALITIGAALTDIDWPTTLSVSATAALMSVLSSIASTGVGSPASPSLLRGRE